MYIVNMILICHDGWCIVNFFPHFFVWYYIYISAALHRPLLKRVFISQSILYERFGLWGVDTLTKRKFVMRFFFFGYLFFVFTLTMGWPNLKRLYFLNWNFRVKFDYSDRYFFHVKEFPFIFHSSCIAMNFHVYGEPRCVLFICDCCNTGDGIIAIAIIL